MYTTLKMLQLMAFLRGWSPHPLSIFSQERLRPSVEQCCETGNCVEIWSLCCYCTCCIFPVFYFILMLCKLCAEWSLLYLVSVVINSSKRPWLPVERAHDKRTPTLGEQQSCLCQVSGIKIQRTGSFEKLLINNASTFAPSQHLFCTISFARKDWILFRYFSSSVI